MESTTITRQYKLEKWTQIICECRSSGLTIAQWCKANAIQPSNYYYWLKRVRQAACDTLPAIKQELCNIVPLTVGNQVVSDKTQEENLYALRIVVSDFTLEFSNNASASLIENAIKVLSHVR